MLRHGVGIVRRYWGIARWITLSPNLSSTSSDDESQQSTPVAPKHHLTNTKYTDIFTIYSATYSLLSLSHCSPTHSTIGFCLAQPLCSQDHYCVVKQCVVATKCNDNGDLLTSLTIKNILTTRTTRIKLECFYHIDLEPNSSLITSQVQTNPGCYKLTEQCRWA